MEYIIHPHIGKAIALRSDTYSFSFFHSLDLILPGATEEINHDCIIPVKLEVLWNGFIEENGEVVPQLTSYDFDASLRLWNMELIDGKDDIEKLECGADYLLRDTKSRFFIYKDREGLGTLFYKKDFSNYINLAALKTMHSEAMEDYHELFETPYYEYSDKLFEIRMVLDEEQKGPKSCRAR
ncbi:hypothetical protein [Litorimonas haliclonae]|uniref:hypothetical protein n=1 Tax=Litorimonas haliclonae TaxID=2081977 RepID=UPI0039EEF829